nr:unnamed protein product [Spirometra erinaceieuropaei]
MLKTDDGVELYKDDEKAEHLSRFFQSVFTREVAVPTDHCNVDNVPTIDSVFLTKPIVQQELLKLKEGTSPGPDEIPAKLLKELATELAEPLSLLFQASLDAGRLPPEWKTAWISPIHKNGSRASANNYRPVSLTSICCKVMERIIKCELMRFLEQNHLLCDAQHGFRRGRSCLTNLLYCLEQWTRAIDEGNVVHVAYIDFKKAFDSVSHQRLLNKLSRIGVRGKLLKWIENFLVGRSQTVRLGGQHSAEVTVTNGVPQGSVLGPILFLIYIDDCIHGLDCKIAMFADDIKLWTVIRNEDDEANLQANLDRLEKWRNQPELEAALVVWEVIRHKVDITVPKEARFSKQGQLEGFGKQTEHLLAADENASVETRWCRLRNAVYSTDLAVLGRARRQHQDWFDENDATISNLLPEKNRLHGVYLDRPTDAHKVAFYQ